MSPPVLAAAGPEIPDCSVESAAHARDSSNGSDSVIRLEAGVLDGAASSFGSFDDGFIQMENGLILEGIFADLGGEEERGGSSCEVVAGEAAGLPAASLAEALCERLESRERRAEPVESVFDLLDRTDFMVVVTWAVQVAAAFVCGRLLSEGPAGQFLIVTGSLLAAMFIANSALFAFGRKPDGASSDRYLKSSGLLSLASVCLALILFFVRNP